MKRILKFTAVALFASGSLALSAENVLSDIGSQARQDLEGALAELSTVREQIREESVPLSRRVNALKAETRGLRKELEREQRLRDSRLMGTEALETRVAAIAEENDYISGLMNQFQVELQVLMTSAEQQRSEAELVALRTIFELPDASPTDKYEAQLEIVQMGLERLRTRLGGAVYEGQAFAPDGTLVTGRFVELGPVSVFSATSGEAGIVESHVKVVPAIKALNPGFASRAQALASAGTGDLDLDVTLGSALAIEGAKQSITEHVRSGGFWVIPILFFGLIATLFAIYKAATIYRIKHPSAGQIGRIARMLRAGQKTEALGAASALPWEFAPMVEEAIRHSDQDKELVEEVMYEKMLEAQPKVERFLSVIAVTAAVAPLLGLLGTVTGMINTFKMITLFGTGDASSLSGGISEALVTTELGLVVAIPALVAHAVLNRKAQAVMAQMEKAAVVFVNGLPGNKPAEGVVLSPELARS